MQSAIMDHALVQRKEPRDRALGLRRAFDLAVAIAVLPLLGLVALALWGLNPRYNPGPLFFTQWRVGRHGKPFRIVKFRSMRPGGAPRAFDAPLERWRITPLGGLLRRHRIDELPQILNVLRGEMSVIGPRPDTLEHAAAHAAAIAHYRRRAVVRPGITGLAQVRHGYAVGLAETARKAHADLAYIRARSVRLDAYILAATVRMVLTGRGTARPRRTVRGSGARTAEAWR